jgi:hypothetical protein
MCLAMIRMSVGSRCGVTPATTFSEDPIGTGELRRPDALLQPHRGHAAPVPTLKANILLLLSWAYKVLCLLAPRQTGSAP